MAALIFSRAEASPFIRLEEGSPDPRTKRPGLVAVETPKRTGIRIRAITARAPVDCSTAPRKDAPQRWERENQLIARRSVARRLGRPRIREKAEGSAGELGLRRRR